MSRSLPIEEFIAECSHGTIIDVRSPAEYTQGHLPKAINLPLFSNEERAEVGTIYKQTGRDEAFLKGLEFVGPKMSKFVESISDIPQEQTLGIHCWRGGERSRSMAWLVEKSGRSNVLILEKGYKAFRNHVLDYLSREFNLQILGGYTGSGKTEVLAELAKMGEQVVCLESLANHRGSAFGALGQQAQPSNEHFENLIFDALSGLDLGKRVWLEDESRHIGSCKIPDSLFDQMRVAPTLFLRIPQELRVERLVVDYGLYSEEELRLPIEKIGKRLGGQNVKAALEALAEGNLHEVARITLRYYDRSYRYGLEQRDGVDRSVLELSMMDPQFIAEQCIEYVS